jgi:hypothetical protein
MTIFPTQNWVSTGCFSGTIEKFLDAVEKKHGDNIYGKNYRMAIEFAKNIIREEK